MNSYQPARCTSEFVRKQLQNTIHGRQKPAGGKDLPGAVAAQKSRSIQSIIQSNDFFSFPSDEFSQS